MNKQIIKNFLQIAYFGTNRFLKSSFIAKNHYNYSSQNFFETLDLFQSFFLLFSWLKVRVLYYVNNWVYTTNHKRIAVNYFWFVILAGIFGMVLATVIRLELAYPGVGIFAGDSLQYLSLVTAHGVIMVFFMIIPLISGAFANFLLPTQLGVHDVAFPRLNSAAFWFLPGGLILLGQLICIDRRYQRMNAFNIREIQSILKRRFFTDLINVHEHRNMLDQTMLGLRFKTNDLSAISPNIFLFYNYGIESGPKYRFMGYNSNVFCKNNEAIQAISTKNFFIYVIAYTQNVNFLNNINVIFLNILENLYFLTNFFITFKNLYINVNSTTLSLMSLTSNDSTVLFNNIIASFRSFFFFFVTPYFFTNLSELYQKFLESFFVAIYSFVENNLYLYLYWLQITHLFYTFEPFSIIKNFLLKCFGKITQNLTSYSIKSIGIVIKDYFFIIQLPEIKHTYQHDSLVNLSYYLNYLFLFYNYLCTFFEFFKNNFFVKSSLPYSYSNYETTVKHLNAFLDQKPYTQKNYFLYDKTNIFKMYWFNHLFYQRTEGTMGFTKTKVTINLEHSSFTIYFHILLNILYNLPIFGIQFLVSLSNFQNLLVIVNDFYNFMVIWYIPLIVNDNIFNWYTKYGNNSTLRKLAKQFNDLIFSIWGFIIETFEKLYNTFIQQQLSFNITDFCVKGKFFVFEIATAFMINLQNIIEQAVRLTVTLFFNLQTFTLFSIFYDFFLFEKSFFKQDVIKKFLNESFLNYQSNYFTNIDEIRQNKYANEEVSSLSRYQRFSNPIFKYDYKSGDYFPKVYKEIYASLLTTILDLTSALRTSPWFMAAGYSDGFNVNFKTFFENITQTNATKTYAIHSWNTLRIRNTDAFYNFFFNLNTESVFANNRWISVSTANQKFSRMFNGSSMQQRIYSNWRQLKFTREAWRCKLLAARHQKTLFRRYLSEDGVFWSIERNARDLLPGWAMITPFSSRIRYTAIGKVDIGLMAVFLVLNSSIVSAANFLVTYRYLSTLNNRKMRDARSFFTEGIMVSSWMMLAANPMLAIGILMLLSDRHWQTSFFDYSGGGDTVLFQHMFWFFGHPEVYIVIIPTFGFTNTLLSYYLKKRVSARASLLYSMYTIAFLGFFVWGHHMYMVGLSHTTRMLFSTLTVMISVPAATKIMHWCVTIANSAFTLELPLLCILTFIFLFVSGGISGMCVAHTGMDVLFHDTFYVIGHFHVMFAGAAMFGSWAAFYFYFPAIFGVKYSRIYAYMHYMYYLIGHLLTFIPMFWLGYAGMPRRVLDYPSAFGGWHSLISAGHMLSVAGLIAFFIMIFDSLRQAKVAVRNTFGISRYNNRLNFYIYEGARSLYLLRKGLYLYRFLRPSAIKLNGYNYTNYEYLETTLLSYTFRKKNL